MYVIWSSTTGDVVIWTLRYVYRILQWRFPFKNDKICDFGRLFLLLYRTQAMFKITIQTYSVKWVGL